MREIKFRAWIIEIEEYRMLNIFGEWDCEDCLIVRGNSSVESEYIEQFTGLRDKNGKEIYEGDIVTHPDADGVCVIKFNEYEPSWMAEDIAYDDCGYHINLDTKLEIIGNIHENPELLKGDIT